MKGQVDTRSLVMKGFLEPFNENTLESVAICLLPGGKVDLDEIPQRISEELNAVYRGEIDEDIVGHEITDNRHESVMGAGFGVQELMLVVTGGAATLLLERLFDWCLERFNDQRSFSELNQLVEGAKSIVSEHFKVKGYLDLLA